MNKIKLLFQIFIIIFFTNIVNAQLVLESSFNPSQTGSLCGLAHYISNDELWVIGCSSSEIHQYDLNGNFISAIPMPGTTANDVDLEIAPENLMLGNIAIAEGQLLVINGEVNEAIIYAIDKNTGNIISTLTTQFGNSHVVGGAYHSQRNTFFLIQDRVPSTSLRNRISEIDPVTGDVINSFQITSTFSVNFGDLDISTISGNLFVVSNEESTIAEYTPDGVFVQELALPAGVSNLRGISLESASSEIWLAGSSEVFLVSGLSLSINDYSLESLISVFPNPTSNYIHVQIQNSINITSINLYDATGKSIKITAENNLIDVSGLKSGIYFLSIETPLGTVTKIIIKS